MRAYAFLILPFVTLAAFHFATDRAPMRFTGGYLTDPSGRHRVIALPYLSEHEPARATYEYQLYWEASPHAQSAIRIVPDDCLRSLSINGRSVSLAGFSERQLCDINAGVTIDASEALRSGENIMSVQVENLRGNHGLAVNSVPACGWGGSALLLALLLGAAFTAIRSLPLTARERLIAAALFALAGWLRYRYVFEWHSPERYLFSDMAGYVSHARELAQGAFGERQLFQPVGYSLLLAASLKLGGDFRWAELAQVALGWATVLLVWRATARWLGERRGLWALAIVALHFPLIALSGFFLAETVFAFQLAILYALVVRFTFPWRAPAAFLIGVTYMSALWFKGTNAFFGPLVVAWAAYWAYAGGAKRLGARARRLLAPLGAFCAGAACVTASHAAFTYLELGHAQLSASAGGLNLVEGKCPSKLNIDSTGATWHSPLFVQLGERAERHWPRPFTDQDYFWGQGLECIRQDPAVLLTSLRYVYYLFFDNQLWPANVTEFSALNRGYAMFYATAIFPALLIGLLLIVRRPRRRSVPAALIGISILACAWFFKSEIRFRVPFDVIFIPIAVLGASWLRARLWPARSRVCSEPDRRPKPSTAREAA